MLHAIQRLLFERILHTLRPPRQSKLGQAPGITKHPEHHQSGITKHPEHHPSHGRKVQNQCGFHPHVQEAEAGSHGRSHGRKAHARAEGVLARLRNTKIGERNAKIGERNAKIGERSAKGHTLSILQATIRTL